MIPHPIYPLAAGASSCNPALTFEPSAIHLIEHNWNKLELFSNSTTTTYLKINTNNSLRVCRRRQHHQSPIQEVLTSPGIENTAVRRLSCTKSLWTASKCPAWGDMTASECDSPEVLAMIPSSQDCRGKICAKISRLEPEERRGPLLIVKVTWKIRCIQWVRNPFAAKLPMSKFWFSPFSLNFSIGIRDVDK